MSTNDVAILIIDMQQDFLSPASPLFVAGGPAIVPNLQRAVKAARSANESIVHVTRRHRSTGIDVDQSRRALFAKGRIPGSRDSGAEDRLTCTGRRGFLCRQDPMVGVLCDGP